ncbi:hypothetical protein [Thermogemmatispora sp.]|uniref:hypothetical protein n=1 Tax=Thermogemmatispora sp. TaxID=1968838 RepID=UPI0035E4300C
MNQQSQSRPGQDGDFEFVRLSSNELRDIPVVAQALDNQWVPRSLLEPVFRGGGITTRHARLLNNYVRAEYIRFLLQSEQLVVNRAYLYNSATIAQDYVGRRNAMRPVFEELLEQAVIVPFLLYEHAPGDPPLSAPVSRNEGAYGVTNAFKHWQEVCQEVRPRCLRLSWDDQENGRLVQRALVHPFAGFAQAISQHDLDLWLQDLALDESAREPFRQRLAEVERFCLDLIAAGRNVTRDALYKRFVVAGDEPAKQNTAQRLYDGSKPFAAQLKQLFDLRYNASLSDALGSYLLTPADSLPRLSLQELHASHGLPTMTGEQLVQLVKRVTFDLLQQGLNITSLHMLSLQDVADIRRTDEWQEYMQRLRILIADPYVFAEGGAAEVYESYMRLTRRIVQRVSERRKRIRTRVWSPVVTITFNLAGALLEVTLTRNGLLYSLAGQVAGTLLGEAATVVATLVIRDAAQREAQQDLSMSVDFMRCRLQAAREQWREIQGMIRSLPGFEPGPAPVRVPDRVDANLSAPESEIGPD